MTKLAFRWCLAATMLTMAVFALPKWSAAGSAPGLKQSDESEEVKIDNFTFEPKVLTIAIGTRVTWTNQDDITHTVVNTDTLSKSPVLDTDEKFSFVFSKAGTYPYFCSIHPKMTATVIVK